MAEVTAQLVKELREMTQAGMMDCKKALLENGGDMEKAVEWLREKGLAAAAKKAGRIAAEGMVAGYVTDDAKIGVIVEVNCETDFVGRSEIFRQFAHEMALQIAATNPSYIREEDVPQSVLDHEAAIATAKAKEDGKPESVWPRIIEGSIAKFKDDFVLLRQKYIRDESKTVSDLLNETIVSTGENVLVRRFVRWGLGEVEAE